MALVLFALLSGAAIWLALNTSWRSQARPEVKPIPVRTDEHRRNRRQ